MEDNRAVASRGQFNAGGFVMGGDMKADASAGGNPQDVSFGALAAERDDDLRAYFVDTEAYRGLRDGEKMVALGNRGSGKTAIFKMIAEYEKSRGATVLQLTPDDYSYELLSKTMLPEDKGAWAKQGAYAAAWKYLIYVVTMKALSKSGSSFKRGAEAKVYEYLRDNHKSIEPNTIGLLISYLKRLEGVKVGHYEAGIKTKELHQLYKLEELAPLLESLNAVARKQRVRILIDELDRGWDNSEDAVAFIAGLFQAAISITETTPDIRILVSLRKELYESIPALYDDAQKYRDVIQVIEWDEPELQELIARRIAHSLPNTQTLTGEQQWAAFFSETLEYRQTKSFNYVVDRTLYRPRELIQFGQMIRQVLVEEKLPLPATYQSISEAELGYSEERLKDIASEYRFQYPGLQSVFGAFRGLTYVFERTDIEHLCLSISVGDTKVDKDASTWASHLDPQEFIKILWTIGFLRAHAVGGLKARRRSGSSYLGSHQISSLSLSNVARFHVHPMFRAFLGMKEPKNST